MLGNADGKKKDLCNETEPNFWWHTSCGGSTYIDEYGDIHCECPGGQGVLFNCSFRCGERRELVAKFNCMDALQGLSLAEGSMFCAMNEGQKRTRTEED